MCTLISLSAGNYLDCIAEKVYAVHKDGTTTLLPRETYATRPERTITDIITSIAEKDPTITMFTLCLWDDVQREQPQLPRVGGHEHDDRSVELQLNTGYLMLGDVFTWTIDGTHTRTLSAILSSTDNKMCYGIFPEPRSWSVLDIPNAVNLLEVDRVRMELAQQAEKGRLHPAVQATEVVFEP